MILIIIGAALMLLGLQGALLWNSWWHFALYLIGLTLTLLGPFISGF